jgi:hypothetical protein
MTADELQALWIAARQSKDDEDALFSWREAAAQEWPRIYRQLKAAEKDAQRYRWMRTRLYGDLPGAVHDLTGVYSDTPEEMDAAIDVAMGKEKAGPGTSPDRPK